MKTETTEVLEVAEIAPSIKEIAARAAIGAIVGVVVTHVATYLIHKGVKRFQKPKLTVVKTEK